MIRTNLHLAKDHLERLRTLADAKGVSVAELVRRAIEAYLQKEGGRGRGRRSGAKGE